MFRHNWIPAKRVLEAARRGGVKGFNPERPLLKWEFRCSKCGTWHPRKNVEIDHLIQCGSLRCAEDLPGFLARLHNEDPSCYQVLCKPCHKLKTADEREQRNAA